MSIEDSAIEVTDVAAIFGAVASGVQPRVAGIPAMDEGAFGADARDTQRARSAVRICECASSTFALELWRELGRRPERSYAEPPPLRSTGAWFAPDGLPVWVNPGGGESPGDEECEGAGALLHGFSIVAWHLLARNPDGAIDRASAQRAFAERSIEGEELAQLSGLIGDAVDAAGDRAELVFGQRAFVEYLAYRYHIAECNRLARLDCATLSEQARVARTAIGMANVLALGPGVGLFVDGTRGLPQLDEPGALRLHRWCVREALDDRFALAEDRPPTPAADTRRLVRWFAFRLASATFVARGEDDVWNANSAATAEFVRGAIAFPHVGLLLGGRRIDLSEANLSHLELQGADLRGARLSGAFLGGADLSGANLRGVFLGEASLSETNLNGADLCDADLSEATMCRTWLVRARLHRADLSDAVLSSAHLGEAELMEANLLRADLSGADLRLANLLQAELRESVLNEANLTDAKLVRATLKQARLFMAQLVRADLYKANLESADLTNADLSAADLRGADFTAATLDRASLAGADASRATFVRARLRDTNLSGATFEGADLTWADLRGADLRGARFGSANLFGADLRGADLRDVHDFRVDEQPPPRPGRKPP